MISSSAAGPAPGTERRCQCPRHANPPVDCSQSVFMAEDASSYVSALGIGQHSYRRRAESITASASSASTSSAESTRRGVW